MRSVWLIATLLIISTAAHTKPVLFIGDSHSVGHFGIKLDSLLREKYPQVQTIASCGAVASWFFSGQKTKCGYFHKNIDGKSLKGKEKSTPKIKNVLEKLSPELIVIALGANYTYRSDSYAIEDMKNLLDHTEKYSKNCFWIGPPQTRKIPERLPRLYRLIKIAIKDRCQLFQSHLITKYPDRGSDGIHYWGAEGKKEAYKWANKAFDFLSNADNKAK